MFAAIVALAFLIVFLAVVPQLRSNLESQRLRDLEDELPFVYEPALTAS